MPLSIHTADPEDVSPSLWAGMDELRRQSPQFRNPFFAPGFARTVSRVRDDIIVHSGEDGDVLAFFWPIYVSGGRKARGLGGPFSDRNGPVVHSGFELDVVGFLKSRNICCFHTGGYVCPALDKVEAFSLPRDMVLSCNGVHKADIERVETNSFESC